MIQIGIQPLINKLQQGGRWWLISLLLFDLSFILLSYYISHLPSHLPPSHHIFFFSSHDRVWRDGQKKKCYVYRFLTTGTLEEKIFQRQLSKEGLQSIVDDKDEINSFNSSDLTKLFKLKTNTISDTHDKLGEILLIK